MSQRIALVGLFLFLFYHIGCFPYQRHGAQKAAEIDQNDAVTNPESGIVSIGQNAFRINEPVDKVWGALLEVLIKDYNLTLVDRSSGIVTTEWNAYYADQGLYRNKVSIRLSHSSPRVSQLYINNHMEELRREDGQHNRANEVWAPSPKSEEEMIRIIFNLAIVLDQPQPTLAPEMEASRKKLGKPNISRNYSE